jgi:putative tricarboxylic transport membrane protein
MRTGDVISGLLVALLGAAVVAEAATFPPMPGQPVGPSLFPMVLGFWLITAGAMLMLAPLRAHGGRAEPRHETGPLEPDTPAARRRAVANVAIVLGDLLFYALSVKRLGFLLTALVFLTILFGAFGVRRTRILPLAIAVTLVVHFAFYTLLRVPLPWGVLEGIAW